MRTVEKIVYKFGELSEQAKEVARNYFYAHWSYPWAEENREALQDFADRFGVHVRNWSYDEHSSYVDFDIRRNYPEHTGIRLYKWIMYNMFDHLYSPAYLNHVGGKARYSKVKKQRRCPTGYCMSEAMQDPIHEFLQKPDSSSTMESLIKDCIDKWCDCAKKDVEYYYSDESITEALDANEIEFYEDGRRA